MLRYNLLWLALFSGFKYCWQMAELAAFMKTPALPYVPRGSVLQYVKALARSFCLLQRMLLMKDMEVVLAHCDTGSAIEIDNATLAWEKPASFEKTGKPSRFPYITLEFLT